MPIQCVIFDLDDTLWEGESLIRNAEVATYNWLSAHYARITERYTLADLIQHRINFMSHYPELHYNLTILRKYWLAHLADEAGYSRALVDPAFMVFWLARHQVQWFEGVLSTLECLAQDYQLGVISNGNADVHYLGIGTFFAFVHSASSVGVAKPHPAIFQHALQSAQLPADQVVYVGDDLKNDIAGALSVGMRTIWLQPARSVAHSSIRPDITIQHFAELVSALKTL
ncbi:MAG: HAD family hydrolase [Thiofilum sp.]|uniref:HAD family hydrolase n=1 Tax=Thiofilum sp. TaxID=2212733 RepID=UPI0025E203B5|nr:HAD family hydrolase [Thiofilum sp.]MBK8452780.1 HAD family hydrolase [Thiofilum sp.]